MKFFCSVDVYFEIVAKSQDEIFTKAWDFVHNNLPESFCTEGSEIYIEAEE